LLVSGHTLPRNIPIDGLLGLDFLRGLELNINFRTGQITLT
jgi:predicted aspartyl protease